MENTGPVEIYSQESGGGVGGIAGGITGWKIIKGEREVGSIILDKLTNRVLC